MHIVTGYTGENHITSADDASLHRAIFGEGDYVLDTGSKFKATIIDNNTIRIDDGDLLIQGHLARINPGEYEEVTIDNGTPGSKRYDLIVAKYIKDNVTGIESVTIEVIKGTAGETPTEPDITQDDLKTGGLERDFVLYRVLIDGTTIDSVSTQYETVSALRTFDGGIVNEAGSGSNFITSSSGHNFIGTLDGSNFIHSNNGYNEIVAGEDNLIRSISGKNYIKTGSQTITFPDDFASGTWTPVLTDFNGNPQPTTYTSAQWQKTGNAVTIQIEVTCGSGVAGNLLLTGMPPEIRPSSSRYISGMLGPGAGSPNKMLIGGGFGTAGIIFLQKNGGGYLNGADIASGDLIILSGSYIL
jgi:hypothetical protein